LKYNAFQIGTFGTHITTRPNALPNPTLQAIGTALEQMRERTPRGGIRWAPSSVKHLLDKAKAAGLVRGERAARAAADGPPEA
jgi:hypothetical protein